MDYTLPQSIRYQIRLCGKRDGSLEGLCRIDAKDGVYSLRGMIGEVRVDRAKQQYAIAQRDDFFFWGNSADLKAYSNKGGIPEHLPDLSKYGSPYFGFKIPLPELRLSTSRLDLLTKLRSILEAELSGWSERMEPRSYVAHGTDMPILTALWPGGFIQRLRQGYYGMDVVKRNGRLTVLPPS